jgi:hypothetical protein
MTLAGVFGMLVISLLAGGPNDLLDSIPTQDYWKAKGIDVNPRTIEALLAMPVPVDVSGPIKDLGSDDFQTRQRGQHAIEAVGLGAVAQLNDALKSTDPIVVSRARGILTRLGWLGRSGQVRVLMAIRTLGEIKDRGALPALRGLLTSKEEFVADYAGAAIAAIEGTPYTRPKVTAEQLRADVALLPAGVDTVAQLHVIGGPVLASMAKDVRWVNLLLNDRDRQSPAVMFATKLIEVAEKTGNIRLDSLTIGMGEPCCVYILRATYDPAAIAGMLTKDHADATMREENGDSIISERGAAIVLRSSGQQLIRIEGVEVAQALAQLVAAVRSRDGGLEQNATIARLLRTIDRTGPFWLAMPIAKPSRHARCLDPFDALTLTTQIKSRPRIVEFTMRTTGGSKQDREALVRYLREDFQGFLTDYKQMKLSLRNEEADDGVGLIDLINTIAMTADDGGATMTGTVNDSGAMGSVLSECLYLLAVTVDACRPASDVKTPPAPTSQPAGVPPRRLK